MDEGRYTKRRRTPRFQSGRFMKLGIDLDGRIPISDMVEMCQVADAAGFHSVWADQHLGYRDAVSTSVASSTNSRTPESLRASIKGFASNGPAGLWGMRLRYT